MSSDKMVRMAIAFDRWEFAGSTTSSATNYNAEWCSYSGS